MMDGDLMYGKLRKLRDQLREIEAGLCRLGVRHDKSFPEMVTLFQGIIKEDCSYAARPLITVKEA